ncbi:unnamed protein product [Spirodela intermedia]|uniref:Probable magnesium transporter n=1 Tax=Spirodela intermedia TaxID=51605 RepID=A0A7I8IXA0_SPIIN|nr:unnamed protein product [Spirodela intermedia]CAA6662402.1 unnamed protein product [Spirodela intermedia]
MAAGGYRGMSSDNIKGLVLALSSSVFIGASFIVKKKGLKKAGASGVRAGAGGYSYLYEPLWWAGMITMIVGEVANFAAYAFAPAILVTPLGALSIIIRHEFESNRCTCSCHLTGKTKCLWYSRCVLCIVGSTTMCLHAPQEREIESVKEVWNLATEPVFLLYAMAVVATVFILIFRYIPQYGQTHIMVYIGVCSLVGSLSGIALKLTFSGMNQLIYPETWAFTIVVGICDWTAEPTQIVTEMCGFVTILSGTFLLHKTKDMPDGLSPSFSMRFPKHSTTMGFPAEGIPLRNGVTAADASVAWASSSL